MYIISIDPNLWTSTYLKNKKPKTFKSSMLIGIRGDNSWAANQQLIIDASPIGLDSVTFDMANYVGKVNTPKKSFYTKSTGIPTLALPYVTLDAGWNEKKQMAVEVKSVFEITMLEGIDWVRDKPNDRINILNARLYDKEIDVHYWSTINPIYTDSIETTIRKLISDINNKNIGCVALPTMEIYDFCLESIMIGDDADKIAISRANVAAGEILLNREDVDGPVTLAGNATNEAHTAVALMKYEDGELYIEGIPGGIVSQGNPKIFDDSRFESFDRVIKGDIAQFVAKGILKVQDPSGAFMTPAQVLHAGYDTVKIVP